MKIYMVPHEGDYEGVYGVEISTSLGALRESMTRDLRLKQDGTPRKRPVKHYWDGLALHVPAWKRAWWGKTTPNAVIQEVEIPEVGTLVIDLDQ